MNDLHRHLRLLHGTRASRSDDPAGMAWSAFPVGLHVGVAEGDGAGFGARGARLLEGFADVVAEPARAGVVLLARSEAVLAAPLERLRALVGGAELVLDGPYARRWPGRPDRWPVMAVQVLLPRLHAARVRFDLTDRGARGLAVGHGPLSSLIRAEAPLARLIGYERWLAEATGGLAEASIELLRYAPADPDADPDPTGPRAA